METFCSSGTSFIVPYTSDWSTCPTRRYCSKCGTLLSVWETYYKLGFIITGWHDTIDININLCNHQCCIDKLK